MKLQGKQFSSSGGFSVKLDKGIKRSREERGSREDDSLLRSIAKKRSPAGRKQEKSLLGAKREGWTGASYYQKGGGDIWEAVIVVPLPKGGTFER